MQSLTLTALLCITLAGSRNYKVREAIQPTLDVVADLVPTVIFAGERAADGEIARRCRIAGNKWCWRHADELSRSAGPLPPISKMPGLDDWQHGGQFEFVASYIDQADGKVSWPSSFWDCGWWSCSREVLCEATRLWLRDRIATRSSWRETLAAMRAAEAREPEEK